jgi:hypothetical protein
MKDRSLMLYRRIHELLLREEGQDLVEYVMVFAIMALGTAAAMESMDAAIIQVCLKIGAIFSAAFAAV